MDINEEKEAYNALHEITSKLLEELKNDNMVVARRFADKYKFPMEYVHEAFDILHPFLNSENIPFELDEIDPLYNFPKEIKESSRVFFTLGRRDAKLEYQHRLLSS